MRLTAAKGVLTTLQTCARSANLLSSHADKDDAGEDDHGVGDEEPSSHVSPLRNRASSRTSDLSGRVRGGDSPCDNSRDNSCDGSLDESYRLPASL